MNIWTMADPHFGHDKMIKESLLPVGYEDKIFNSLYTQIKLGDIFICLGDVAFYDTTKWHLYLLSACCNCNTRILVRGNHDKETLTKYYKYGWSFVCDEFKLKVYGKTLLFSHAPVVGRTDFDFNIHGHLHNDDHRGSPAENGILVYTKLVNVKTIIGM